jgi:hypothetical protein
MAQKQIESGDQSLGKLKDYDLPAQGNLDRSEFRDEIDIVNEHEFNDMAKLEAFMMEMVLVEIAPTNDKNAELVVTPNVRGVPQNMLRGKQQWIKRCYLECLARAKDVGISTQEYVNFQGDKSTKIVRNAGLLYPFRVIEDKNPRGAAWLQQILAEPA